MPLIPGPLSPLDAWGSHDPTHTQTHNDGCVCVRDHLFEKQRERERKRKKGTDIEADRQTDGQRYQKTDIKQLDRQTASDRKRTKRRKKMTDCNRYTYT